jgi:hypothetical protein
MPQVVLLGNDTFLLANSEDTVSTSFTCLVTALPPVSAANISWFSVNITGDTAPLSGEVTGVNGSTTTSVIGVNLGVLDERVICRAENTIGSGEDSIALNIYGECGVPVAWQTLSHAASSDYPSLCYLTL